MLDALKTLIETNVISEEIKGELETAWNTQLQESRVKLTQELREEFAQKYEHDRNVMVEAIDKLVSDRLSEEIAEFREDRAQLMEAKAQYAKKLKEHASHVDSFVTNRLAREIRELHTDQQQVTSNFAKLEHFVVEALSREIADFYNDKKDLAATKVRLVKEGKEQYQNLRNKFITNASKLTEQMITRSLAREIKQLREDIDQARKNDFGRRIFEAFTSEYQHNLINEQTETGKLMRMVRRREKALAEARKVISQKQKLVENTLEQVSRVKDQVVRSEIINELLTPLAPEQKGLMRDLLESVQTNRLRTHYERYLPTLLQEKSFSHKSMLKESRELTGNKQPNSMNNAASQGEVTDIRRLAGL
jgi:hypothetical protein